MTTGRRPVPLSAALVAMVVILAAGCSGNDDEDDAAPTTTTSTAAAATEESTTSSSAAPAAESPGNTVTVDMKEYAYAVSGALTAGTSTVVMKNSGQELHMTGFGLLRSGKKLEDVRRALASEDDAAFDEVFQRELDAPGGLLSPGQTMEVTTSFLEAGSYALMCFVPTVGEAVPHTAKGMIATLDVAAGDVVSEPKAGARYVVDNGRIEGPATLAAGKVTLEMSSGAAGPHELIVARKKDPATTFEAVDDAFTALFDGEVPPAPGYAERLPAVIAGNVFDVPTGKSVFVTLDLVPGRYFIGCARAPDDESAEGAGPHEGELVEVTVT